MKLKKFFGVLTALIIMTAGASALPFTVELSIPAKLVLAQHEVEINGNYREIGFMGLPIPFFGPFRAQYIFNPDTEGKWTFGAGLSTYIWPFQTISLTGSADCKLYTFSNGGTLHLMNILEAGLFNKFSKFYDVDQGKYVTTPNFSPALEYGLEVVYRTHQGLKYFIGFGPGFAGAIYSGDLRVYYGFNIEFGVRI